MFLTKFAELFIRFRLGIAAVVVVVTLLASWGISRLTFDDDPRGTFRSADADFLRLEEIFEQFGSDENNCIILVKSEDLFSRPALTDLAGLVSDIGKINGIEDVAGLADRRLFVLKPFPHPLVPSGPLFFKDPDQNWFTEWVEEARYVRAKHEARAHPLVAKYLLSEDGNATLIMARLEGENLTMSEVDPVVAELREVVNRWKRKNNLKLELTGLPVIRSDLFALVRSETTKLSVLGGLASLLLAIVIFRRPAVVFIVFLASGTALLWTLGALGLIGEPINVLTTQLPVLVMIICFTDSIHMAVDIRQSRAEGIAPVEAVKTALRHLTFPCALTSLTTGIGFGSLFFTQTELIRRFGLACAGGAFIAFLSVITVVPLLACTNFLGKGVLPAKPWSTGHSTERVFEMISRRVVRWRWGVTAAGLVLALALIATTLHLQVDHYLVESLPADTESSSAQTEVDQLFGGILSAYVLVEWPDGRDWQSKQVQEVMQKVHDICEQNPGVHHPISILNLLQAVPGGNPEFLPESIFRRLVRDDLNRALVVARVQDRGAAFHKQTVSQLTLQLQELERQHPGFHFWLSGTCLVASRNIDVMITDLARSLGMAIVLIFGVMTLAFRSLRLGVISIIPNALPLLLTASVLVWIDEPLRFAYVIVFSICLGIAVDDTIHYVSRFRRELGENGDVPAAIGKSFQAVGAALVISTLVLLAGFSIILTSSLPTSRKFSLLAFVAISSALAGDLIVLPAMLACFVRSRKQGQATQAESQQTTR